MHQMIRASWGTLCILLFWPSFPYFLSCCLHGKKTTIVLLVCSIGQQLSDTEVPWLQDSPLAETEGSFHRMLPLGTVKDSDIRGKNPQTKPCWLAFVNSKSAVILSIRWYLTVEFFDLSWFLIALFYFWKGFHRQKPPQEVYFFRPSSKGLLSIYYHNSKICTCSKSM